MASEDVGFISEAECEAAKAEKLLFTDTPEYKAKYGLTSLLVFLSNSSARKISRSLRLTVTSLSS